MENPSQNSLRILNYGEIIPFKKIRILKKNKYKKFTGIVLHVIRFMTFQIKLLSLFTNACNKTISCSNILPDFLMKN